MKYKGDTGFALVELLVVIFIISVLSAASFVYLRAGERGFALSRSAQKLAQDIRRVQEMAMAAKSCSECGDIVPPGYGIILDTDWSNKRYRLYADTYPPQGNEFFTSNDTIVEPPYVELEKGVFIKNINTPNQKVSVNFSPPEPRTRIKYEPGEEIDEAIIILSLESDPTKEITIKVNKAGLISLE